MLKKSTLKFAVAALFAAATPHIFAEPFELNTKQYKRLHLEVLMEIMEGDAAPAVDALKKYRKEQPGDPYNEFTLAVAAAQSGDLDTGWQEIQLAVEKGLPVSFILAESGNLLEPLLAHEAFAGWVAEEGAKGEIFGPMLGRMTDDSAGVWLRTQTPLKINLFDGESGKSLEEKEAAKHEGLSTSITFSDLEPDTLYRYAVAPAADASIEAANNADHTFKTFPEEDEGARFRVAFGGGAGYTPQHERMWTTIANTDPLALLLLGDNIYSDSPELPWRQQFCYHRRQAQPEFRALVANVPVFAIWDDHDFSDNDSWGGPEIDEPYWKPAVWERFNQNWLNPPAPSDIPGVWFSFTIADVDFIMLDSRYYRTDPSVDNPSMLGAVQKAWLKDTLASSDATFKVLISAVPWAEGTKGGSPDTWDGYAAEREEIFSFIEDERIDGVFLLSADRHRSDVWRTPRENGYDLIEFESSRLTNMHVHREHPDAEFSYNKKQSFGTLDFDTRAEDPVVTYRIHSIDGEEIHARPLALSDLQHP